MNKKWLTLGGAIGISAVVMTTTGFAAFAGTSGYDTYKTALKNTKSLQSFTVETDTALQDNGVMLASSEGNMRIARDNHAVSGDVSVTGIGGKQTVHLYSVPDGIVWNAEGSDVYYKKTAPGMKRESRKHDPAMAQQMEKVADALVGNLKDYVAVEETAGGSKEVSLHLEGAQIPAVVNAVAPIAISKMTGAHEMDGTGGMAKAPHHEGMPFHKDLFKGSELKLTQDIRVEKIDLEAEINADGYIDRQQLRIQIAGKDAEGAAHTVVLSAEADLSGFNQTTPEKIDLAGKNVVEVKHRFEGRFGHHGE